MIPAPWHKPNPIERGEPRLLNLAVIPTERRLAAAKALLALVPFVDHEEGEWLKRRARQVLQAGDIGASIKDGGYRFTITYADTTETFEV